MCVRGHPPPTQHSVEGVEDKLVVGRKRPPESGRAVSWASKSFRFFCREVKAAGAVGVGMLETSLRVPGKPLGETPEVILQGTY